MTLTRQLRNKFINILLNGGSSRMACDLLGVPQVTFQRWMFLGAFSKTGRYKKFREEIEEATETFLAKVTEGSQL